MTQPTSSIEQVADSETCCDSEWETAYRRFETPEQEVRKFTRRLKAFGGDHWDSSSQIVELFCGRGGGLLAWQRLGFGNLDGVDLSATLLGQYDGPAKCYVADCRELPFPNASRDIIAVQGGLHHLPELPGDLQLVLEEVHRVLRPGGRFVVVEPWPTPFLHFVHFLCERPLARRGWPKLDALATMIEHERTTYEQWLSQPATILQKIQSRFSTVQLSASRGKLCFLGVRQQRPSGVKSTRLPTKESTP